MSVEFRGLSFALELRQGGLFVVASGTMPDPPLTQAEVDIIRASLNDSEPITVGDLVSQQGIYLEVHPNFLNLALAPLWEEVEEENLG